jgi:hypothetical protein
MPDSGLCNRARLQPRRKGHKIRWALAPEGCFFSVLGVSKLPFSASRLASEKNQAARNQAMSKDNVQ